MGNKLVSFEKGELVIRLPVDAITESDMVVSDVCTPTPGQRKCFVTLWTTEGYFLIACADAKGANAIRGTIAEAQEAQKGGRHE